MRVSIKEAKTHLSELVNAAIQGDEVIIVKSGKPIAKFVPLQTKAGRRFGVLKGKIKISNDFNAPLSYAILTDFNGM